MNFKKNILLVLIILILLLTFSFSETFHLKNSVVVFNKNIYLSDIVKEYVPYYDDFIIGQVTSEGTFTFLIKKKFKNINFDKNKIKINYLYIKSLKNRIKAFIKYKLSNIASESQITIKSRIPNTNDCDIRLQTNPPIGWSTLRLIKNKKSIAIVSVYTKIFKNVYISTKDIPSKHLINKSDVEKALLDITNIYRNIPNKVIGMMSKYYIRKGTVIYSNYIMEPLDVVQGETVLMLLKYKNINLDDYGIALSDGRVGDIIRIMNIKSRNIVIGKVIQRGIVEVIIK
jgi:flagella basal body P-ring formation protein FlgA